MTTLLYGFAWALFGITHSVLARPLVQHKLELYLGRSYRFLYNALALLSIGVVLLVGRRILDTSRLALFDNSVFISGSYAIQLLGMVIIVIAFMAYDMGRFVGITQLVTGEKLSTSVDEPLQQNGLNRWVRHPLYTGAFFALWGGAFSAFDIWTAIWGSLYLVIGTHFEERKLIRLYGDQYRTYQREVPRYFPL